MSAVTGSMKSLANVQSARSMRGTLMKKPRPSCSGKKCCVLLGPRGCDAICLNDLITDRLMTELSPPKSITIT